MSDLTPKENTALDVAMTRLGELVDRMERASHPYPRERTWADTEAELAQAKAEVERLRHMLDDVLAEVELPQSIEKRVREALGDE